MSAINQYTELYELAREALESKTPALLNSLRSEARKALAGASLPTKRTEGYAKTSIEDMFAPDYGVNLNRIHFPVDIARAFKCEVPNLSTLLGLVLNDVFVPTATLQNNLPEGATVCSLAYAAGKYPEIVRKYLGRIAPMNNPAVALNTLLLQDGAFIHIPANMAVEHPIQIVNIFSATVPLLAMRRVLIVLDEGASCSVLLCDHTQEKNNSYLSSEVIEVFAGRNSRLDFVSLEESSAKTSRHSMLYARQEDGSDLNVNSTTIHNGNTRNEFNVDIVGEYANTELSGMVIAGGERHVDNYSNVSHNSPHSKSNQLFKYLVDDRATCAFEGGITVSNNAPFTEGYQSNRNILASEDARMYSKPQLLIYNDEVKCSHGAATGQLDEKQLFYMQTRGIPVETARRLLMQAFMTDAVARIRMDAVRTRLGQLIEKCLGGEYASCSGDCLPSNCIVSGSK